MAISDKDRVSRALDAVAVGLAPTLEQALQATWGSRWQEELDSRQPKPMRRDRNMKIVWDAYAVLSTMFHRWNDLFSRADRSARTYAGELLHVRNRLWGHNPGPVSADDAMRALETAERLLREFGVTERADELRTLRVERQRELIGTQQQPAQEGTAADRAKGASSEPDSLRHNAAAEAATVNEPAAPKLPPHRPGVVYFPLVSAKGDFIAAVDCSLDKQTNPRLTRVFGAEAVAEVAEQVIMDARFDEASAVRGQPIIVLFTPRQFSAESFGLGLAVADKMCRLGTAEAARGKSIYATGQLLPEGHGAIGAISGFDRKLNLMLKSASQPAIFLFPKANLATGTPAEQEALASLLRQLVEEKSVECRPVEHIDDLRDMWRASDPVTDTHAGDPDSGVRQPPERRRRRLRGRNWLAPSILGGIAAALVLGVLAINATWLTELVDPVETEARQARLDTLDRAFPDSFRPDAPACEALLQAAGRIKPPDEGRMTARQKEAMKQSLDCRQRLAASDDRLAPLLADANGRPQPPDPAADERLAGIASTLSPFDRSRLSQQHGELLQAADEAAARLALGRSHVAALGPVARGENELDAAACEPLVAAERKLSDYERRLAARSIPQALASADLCKRRLAESDARIAELRAASNASENDSSAMAKLVALSKGLSAFDRPRVEPAISERVQAAEKLLAASNQRIDALSQAVADWERSPTTVPAGTIGDRLAQLSVFDKARLSDSQKSAVDKAADIRRRLMIREKSLTAATIAEVSLFLSGDTQGIAGSFATDAMQKELASKGYRLVATPAEADLAIKLTGTATVRQTAIGGAEPLQGAVVRLKIQAEWTVGGAVYFLDDVAGNGVSTVSSEAALQQAYTRAAQTAEAKFDSFVRSAGNFAAKSGQTE